MIGWVPKELERESDKAPLFTWSIFTSPRGQSDTTGCGEILRAIRRRTEIKVRVLKKWRNTMPVGSQKD